MYRKPWSIVFLSMLHLIAPLFNVIVSASLMGLTPLSYLTNHLFHRGWFEICSFLLISPLAAFCIWSLKRWSYGAYLAIMSVAFAGNTYYWLKYPQLFSIWTYSAMTLINVVVVGFFLVPNVRRAYFDQNIKWWESKPRVKTEILVKVSGLGRQREGVISNLSQGGAYLRLPEVLNDENLNLKFHFLGHDFEIESLVMHKRDLGNNEIGYGLQFESSKKVEKVMKALIKQMMSQGYELTRHQSEWKQDFLEWFNQVKVEPKNVIPKFQDVSKKSTKSEISSASPEDSVYEKKSA